MDAETAAMKPARHSKLYWMFADARVLIWRSAMHILKNFDQLLSAAFMPIMFYLLFRYVFGGAIETGGSSYPNFLMAGILIQMAAFGATYTAIEVATDLQRGIIDRFRSMPMFSSAVLVGHTVADLTRNTISTVIVVLVGLATGFRPTAGVLDWVLVFGILLLFTEKPAEAPAAATPAPAPVPAPAPAPVLSPAQQAAAQPSYPWANAPFPNSLPDPWGMYQRQCVSYTAWKVAQSGRHMPYWGGIGNANQWDDNAIAAGIPVDTNPRVGDVAVSNAGTYGHVMYVEAVNPDGTIYISQYNADLMGNYSEGVRSTAGLVFIHF